MSARPARVRPGSASRAWHRCCDDSEARGRPGLPGAIRPVQDGELDRHCPRSWGSSSTSSEKRSSPAGARFRRSQTQWPLSSDSEDGRRSGRCPARLRGAQAQAGLQVRLSKVGFAALTSKVTCSRRSTALIRTWCEAAVRMAVPYMQPTAPRTADAGRFAADRTNMRGADCNTESLGRRS